MMGERTPPLAGTFGIAQMHGTAAPAPTQHEKALTKRERFSQFRENLRPREGGFTDDPDDDGGPTNKGVSQDLLDLLLEKPQWQHLPKKTVDLTDEQIDAILWSEFFERPKIDQLARVPGLAAAAPNFAEQIFDSGVTSNTAAVGRFLQKALDAVLGTDLRVVKEDGTRDYDGNIGPATRTAVEMAVRKEKIAEVNNRVVDIRSEYFRELVRRNPWKKKYLDGWLKRAESFRMR